LKSGFGRSMTRNLRKRMDRGNKKGTISHPFIYMLSSITW
jgi:hypothetical protein